MTPPRWVLDPNRGGRPVPDSTRRATTHRLQRYSEERFAGRYRELDIRFKAQFCYVDAYLEPTEPPAGWPPPGSAESREELMERLRATPLHLFRLRFFGDPDRWGFAFFSYASERYEPSVFPTGDFHGTPEDAHDVAGALHFD